MKKVLVLALFVSLAFTNTSCNKDKQTKVIRDFVRTYFPQTEMLSCIKDGDDYDVTLNDYTQIGFDGNLFGNLEWDEVDCKRSNIYTSVPSELVPAEIAGYVSQTHGTLSIVKISRDNEGWEIELSNGLDIEFDKRFNVIEIGD